MTRSTCTMTDCSGVVNGRGLCNKHYKRWQKYGDARVTRDARSMSTEDYIAFRTTMTDDGCWLWNGNINVQGYGVASRNGRKITAHRMSYAHYNGPIPSNHDVRHKCDVRPCVNPKHLEVGTRSMNNRDTSLRGRHGNAKLSNDDVVDIRWMHGLGATGSSLARAYNVTPTLISQIVNRKARKNV